MSLGDTHSWPEPAVRATDRAWAGSVSQQLSSRPSLRSASWTSSAWRVLAGEHPPLASLVDDVCWVRPIYSFHCFFYFRHFICLILTLGFGKYKSLTSTNISG